MSSMLAKDDKEELLQVTFYLLEVYVFFRFRDVKTVLIPSF